MSNITMTNTDPGEGSPLEKDEYLAVYGDGGKFTEDDIADNAISTSKIKNGAVNKEKLASDAIYILPTASETTLGGVKVGNNLKIDGQGVLSAEAGGAQISVTNIDPGEGEPLDENNYVAVYGEDSLIKGEDIAKNTVTSDNIDFATFEYSTSEKVVGKWIDGRTIYQKCYQKTSTTAAGAVDVGVIVGTNISPLFVIGMHQQTLDNNWVTLPRDGGVIYMVNSNYHWVINLSQESKKIFLIIWYLKN